MGLFDAFKPKDEQLEAKLAKLEEKIAVKQAEYNQVDTQLQTVKNLLSAEEKAKSISERITEKELKLSEVKNQLAIADDDLEMQTVGFYKRRYKFSDSEKYNDALTKKRHQEKSAVKDKYAGTILAPMTLDGSASKGKTMQNQLIRAAIRGFNGEADALLTKITVANVDKKVQALYRAAEQINKMYQRNNIAIAQYYVDMKRDELYLAAEFEEEKRREKEILREQREKEREDKKLQAEIAAKRKKLQKERAHYENVIFDLREKLSKTSESETLEFKSQIAEYESQLEEINQAEEDVDYHEGHATTGYVYVISNVGSFGPDVYKIGVTRRLDPLERINELGNASVPFKFDVHALVFSEDAFGLETELHNKFDKFKVNKVNSRKEYYHIPLVEIKKAISAHSDVSAEFIDAPEAFEFHQSQQQ